MHRDNQEARGVNRRTAMKLAAGAGVAAAWTPRRAAAADVTLSAWTGYPELAPWYQACGEAYAKLNPGFKLNVLSTTLREHEQKLAAAMPTGTGPDLFDVGLILSINFVEAGLLKPNPPDIDKQFKSGAYAKVSLDQFTVEGKTYGLPILFSTAAMFWNKAMFREAGLTRAPENFTELMEYARKLVKIDSTGKMTRSGISLRLSGQGSGIAEKFRYVMEPAGGSLIVKTPSGKWHQGYDNDAGRNALKFYIDAVQTYHVDDPKILHDADAFVSGTTAMLFREAWVIGEIQKKAPNLEYDVAPIPPWTAGGVRKALVGQDGLFVSAKSRNQAAAYEFMKFLTTPENTVLLTQKSGWVGARTDVDWSPLLKQIPQYAGFTSPPKDIQYYVDPVISPWNEVESRLADLLPAAYTDPALKDNPQKVADFIHKAAMQTDAILKDADMYGTT
ncbi:MAG: extracellular solute-binding protein [Nevskiales bacterium]